SMLAILHPALLFRERDRRAAALRWGFYPVRNERSWCSWRFALLSADGYARGTESSNPSPSSGESYGIIVSDGGYFTARPQQDSSAHGTGRWRESVDRVSPVCRGRGP